jgi:PAS domain S-box-containing protein
VAKSAAQDPLFGDPELRGRPRGQYLLTREQFTYAVLEVIRHYRERGQYPTREQVAVKLHMDVSTFDRYRGTRRYDVFRDWTETIRAYDAVRGAPAQVAPPALPSTAGDVEFVVVVGRDPAGIVNVNDAACALLGYTRAELVGAPYQPMLRPGIGAPPERVEAARRMSRGDLERLDFDTFWITRDGQRIDVHARMTWDKGWVLRCTRIDQPDQNEPLRLPVPTIPPPSPDEELYLALEHDHTTILAVNDAACALLGYSRAELIGSGYEPMLRPGAEPIRATHPDRIERAERVAAGQEPFTIIDTYWISRAGARIDVRVCLTRSPACRDYVLRAHRLPLEGDGPAVVMTPEHWLVVGNELGKLGSAVLKTFNRSA